MTKNIIYINCFADPWVNVAKVMQTKGFEPVYWLGYREDYSSEIIPKEFPKAIFHTDLPNAWRCIFPDIIVQKAKGTTLNIDFLRQFASHELQGIKMMDRLDPDRHSFNFMERQRHWRELIRNWTACIELLKPDLVVTPMLPHRVYDYALYVLCLHHKIPFLTFNHTQFNGRFIVLDNLYSIGGMYKEDYLRYINANSTELYQSLAQDIKKRYDKVTGDYAGAAPYYMQTEAQQQKRSSGTFNHIKNQLRRLWDNRNALFGKEGILSNANSFYYKWAPEKSFQEKTKINILEYYKFRINNNKFLNVISDYYESLTTKPDYSEQYIIYFLHYQPEATTSPTGDIFVDQSLCVDMLLKNTPKEWKVYVKEHPHQFMYHREGATSRIKEFYDDLVKNPRVRLISIEEPSFDLIEHCKAIGTVCGTVGWETIVRGKPVILFGISWYENYDRGVLRITDEASASHMTEFINNYQYDKHALLAYLNAVGANSTLAYYYKATHKQTLGITEEECVKNIVDAIISKYEKITKQE